MRTKNTINNAMFSFISMIVNTALNFGYRTVLIYTLGVEYLGISAFFANVLMLLSLGELGIGQAISYSLYKPLANNDKEKINTLVNVYRKAYKYIGFSIVIFSFLLMPLLPKLIEVSISNYELNSIFSIYVLISALSYFWGYKRTLIIADQKAYKIVPIVISLQIIDICVRILILWMTSNFVMALVAQLLCRLLENILVNNYIDKEYGYLNREYQPLRRLELKKIIINVKAMMFHKVGDFVVNGTDNIVISVFVGVSMLGMYSNYSMLTTIVFTFGVTLFNAVTATMGNIIAKESINESEEKTELLNYISFWLFGFTSITLYILLPPFIELWLGSELSVSNDIVIALCFNHFITGIRVPLGVVKSAAGIYKQDQYAPIIQGFINLGVSLLLVHYYGLLGVLIGTIVSGLLVPNWYRPYILYKYLFKKTVKSYFIQVIKLTLAVVVALATTLILIDNISYFESDFERFLVLITICIFIPNITLALLTFKTKEFCYLRHKIFKSNNYQS